MRFEEGNPTFAPSGPFFHVHPAACWHEGYPLGNGHMGMMFRGVPGAERLDLTEITCFSGSPDAGRIPDGAPEAFQRARAAATDGDYARMTRELQDFIPERGEYGTQLPLGGLTVTDGQQPDKNSYIRFLNLENGVAACRWTVSGRSVSRMAFVSHPDRVGVILFESDDPDLLKLDIGLDGGANPFLVDFLCAATVVDKTGDSTSVDASIRTANLIGTQEVLLTGHAHERIHSGGETGVGYAALTRLMPVIGSRRLLLVACATNFDSGDPAAACRQWLDSACALGPDALLRRHVEDFSSFMKRAGFMLDLPDSAPRPLPKRLERVREGMRDDGLLPLLWQYGRYLLLSSSRADSPIPAPLQGVWNDNVACRIGWTCDMHLDINTQMNYWPAEATNLSECAAPLFRWVRDVLVPNGRRTARRAYGMDGWVAELVSNAWGFTAPYWHTNIAPWPTGGAWTATHLWEHWLFTGDRDFLETSAFPVIEGAAAFFLDYLFDSGSADGMLDSGPSISPENSFADDEETWTNSLSPVCETVIIREILQAFLTGCRICAPDHPLCAKAEAALPRLRPLRVGPDGGIAEWTHDLPARDPQHRHTSHLLSLFPYAQITPEETPTLAEAAQRTIAGRLDPEESWEDTGWARSMLMLYSARLQHADEADRHIQSMLRGLAQPNLLIRHPPTRGAPSFADVYELDGNTGVTACITEMLLQSNCNDVHLLPALPRAWPGGSVTGLRARGGWQVDMRWAEGRLVHARLVGRPDARCTVRADGRSLELQADARGCIQVEGQHS